VHAATAKAPPGLSRPDIRVMAAHLAITATDLNHHHNAIAGGAQGS
jgi:hypothetical protein